jgi:hypothetical protein
MLSPVRLLPRAENAARTNYRRYASRGREYNPRRLASKTSTVNRKRKRNAGVEKARFSGGTNKQPFWELSWPGIGDGLRYKEVSTLQTDEIEISAYSFSVFR